MKRLCILTLTSMFWKTQNYWRQQIGVCIWGVGGMNKWTTEAVKLLCMILKWGIHVTIHLFKPIECPMPGMNPNINSGLWVIMMYQCRFINCKKVPLRCGMLIMREAMHELGQEVYGKTSAPSAQFCCGLKSILGNSLLKKNATEDQKDHCQKVEGGDEGLIQILSGNKRRSPFLKPWVFPVYLGSLLPGWFSHLVVKVVAGVEINCWQIYSSYSGAGIFHAFYLC